MTLDERDKMIMDGLDTLSNVALAELSFDTIGNQPGTAAGTATLSRALLEGLEESLNTPNNLNTPGTSSDVNFNFCSDFDAALPITGKFPLKCHILCTCSYQHSVSLCHGPVA